MLKTQGKKSVGHQITNLMRGTMGGAKTPTPPLPARATLAAPTPRGGTPPGLPLIPVLPTLFRIFENTALEKTARLLGATNGVGGESHA